MGCALAPQHLPGLQQRSRSLRRIPHARGTAVAGRRRSRRGERGAGVRRAQARDIGHSQGHRRDRIGRRRSRARRIRDRGADRRVHWRWRGLGDSVRRRMGVRVLAAAPARALDCAERHRSRADLWFADGARLLGSVARTRARSARNHPDPRSRRGTAGLAAQALSWSRGGSPERLWSRSPCSRAPSGRLRRWSPAGRSPRLSR